MDQIELIDIFLFDRETKRELDEKTLSYYEKILTNFFKITNIENRNITELKIERYITYLKNEKYLESSTINYYLLIIKSFIKFLRVLINRELREKIRNKEPQEEINDLLYLIAEYDAILAIPSLKYFRNEKLPFSLDELKEILKFVKGNPFKQTDKRNYLIIKFIAVGTGARNTACRLLEVTDLENYSCNLDCKNCIPCVRLLRKRKPGKVEVRIEPKTCLEIKKYLRYYNITKFVFDRLSIPQMNKMLNKVLEKAGIEKKGRSIHSLRKTFATELDFNGTSITDISRQIDHSRLIRFEAHPVDHNGVTFKSYIKTEAKKLNLKFIKL